MGYTAFLRENDRFLAFGFMLALLSSLGQTFLIGYFGAPIRTAFDLSSGEYGSIYSLATVISGLSLVWLGRSVDRFDLRHLTVAILLGVAAGALLLAGAVNLIMLGAAFLLLRVFGQGLLMHTAQTTMGRYFGADRGKAVSVATLGLPVAEAILPTSVVLLMGIVGWRGTWLVMALVVLVGALPLALFLLRGHAQRRQALEGQEAERDDESRDVTGGGSWRRADVIRDPRFYGLLPAITAPGFIVTALFFHQDALANTLGWEKSWVAASFVFFAGAHILALVLAGPVVDRLGARRLMAGFLLPMTLALLVLVFMDSPWGAPLYLGLAGLSMGSAATLMGSIWPALYGTGHLGAIRALVHAVMVLVTAVAPGGTGAAMDAGVSLITIAATLAGWNVLAAMLAVASLWRSPAV